MKMISNLTLVPEGEKVFKVETAQHEPYENCVVGKGGPVLEYLEVPPGPAGPCTLHFDTSDEADDFLSKLVTTCCD